MSAPLTRPSVDWDNVLLMWMADLTIIVELYGTESNVFSGVTLLLFVTTVQLESARLPSSNLLTTTAGLRKPRASFCRQPLTKRLPAAEVTVEEPKPTTSTAGLFLNCMQQNVAKDSKNRRLWPGQMRLSSCLVINLLSKPVRSCKTNCWRYINNNPKKIAGSISCA